MNNVRYNIPHWIVLQLTEVCNLRCKMCYEWGDTGSYHNKKELHQLKYSQIEDIVIACQKVKPYYELFGGEPLLYDRINEVIRLIRRYGSKVDIATNGTLLNNKVKGLIESGISRIWVSIDGPEEINDYQRGKGTYKKAVEGIKKAIEIRQDRDTKIGITTIITPHNYKYIEEFFFQIVKEISIDHISIEFQTYGVKEEYERYKEFVLKNFGITDCTDALGLVHEVSEFKDIDTQSLMKQLTKIQEFCKDNQITFYTNPSTIDADNYKNYFTAQWENMINKRTRCPYVWLHSEVGADGGVNTCHTFHDLNFGNINDDEFLDIWNNDKINKFRELLKTQMLPMCTSCSRYFTQGHSSY